MIIIKILYAILFIAIGGSIIKYRKIVKSWTGNFVWAETYLGRGSTYFIIILIGAGFIIYGFRYPFIDTQKNPSSSISQNKISDSSSKL